MGIFRANYIYPVGSNEDFEWEANFETVNVQVLKKGYEMTTRRRRHWKILTVQATRVDKRLTVVGKLNLTECLFMERKGRMSVDYLEEEGFKIWSESEADSDAIYKDEVNPWVSETESERGSEVSESAPRITLEGVFEEVCIVI